MAVKQIRIDCIKCDKPMNLVLLPLYEYVEHIPMQNVQGYRCASCHQLFFTEEQVERMEKRTKLAKQHHFSFQRKITQSGTSLAITIPQELAHHLGLRQGSKVKLIPVKQEGFLVTAEN